MDNNPYTPTFGTLPVALVGRDDIIADVKALFTGFTATNPHWATHLRAQRGAGKTALIDHMQDDATDAGWWVLQEDGGAGAPLIDRIINRSLDRLAEHSPTSKRRKVANVSVLGVGVGLEAGTTPASVTNVRDVLAALLSVEAHGVLITIDEVHQAPDAALNELGNAAQHLHRDGLPLAFVMGGLPQAERRDEPTFLARAWRPELGPLPAEEIERGLVETAASQNGSFQPQALRAAIKVAAGHPYLMQLVGYHAWNTATSSPITVTDVNKGAVKAQKAFNQAITEQMVNRTQPAQRLFLTSMVRLGTPTQIGDIRAEHGWSTPVANVHRRRLLDAGLIAVAGHGKLKFAIPGIDTVLADEL